MNASRYDEEMSLFETLKGLVIATIMLFGFALFGLFTALVVG